MRLGRGWGLTSLPCPTGPTDPRPPPRRIAVPSRSTTSVPKPGENFRLPHQNYRLKSVRLWFRYLGWEDKQAVRFTRSVCSLLSVGPLFLRA